MMKSFLEYVAEDIIKKYGSDLSRIAIVFPNKRASLYMNSYLAHCLQRPIWSPAYITISDFFRQQTSLMIADSIKLICDLHKSFVKCTGIEETLDHFYGWGQLLLADFDDIDKNMARPEKVFANLKDFHELDDLTYLNDDQIATIKRFFINFNVNQDTILKKKFYELWCHFYDIYQNFHERLLQQSLSYEGMLYRIVAEQDDIQTNYDTYIFVGFNLVQEAEQSVFRKLKDKGMALFYWDFDNYYMSDDHEAGHFISRLLKSFPNELDNSDCHIYGNMSKEKNIRFVSASTENIQARFVSYWLRESNRFVQGRETAIVLCDEHLLPTVANCIPNEVSEVNVTTGFPLQCSLISSYVNLLFAYLIYGGKRAYKRLTHHPYASYIDNVDELLADKDMLSAALHAVKIIAEKKNVEEDTFQQESIFRMFILLNRVNNLIISGDLDVDKTTIQRIVHIVINGTAIPFHGEPVEGIQVMGVLETRNIDFKHILILSCNDGNIPKGIHDSSFIPYSIRKAFGLTTVDQKVNVFAYYFYRLIQRAEDVTILYNNSTENGQTGEMSRFMLQMMVEYPFRIERLSLQGGQEQNTTIPRSVTKSEAIMEKLHAISKKGIYPTFLNRYLRCPLQFYFNNVQGIREPDNTDEEEIDNRLFGNIFHKAMQNLYDKYVSKGQLIMAGDIERIEKNPHDIELAVDTAFQEEMKTNVPVNGIQLINREVFVLYVKRLLAIDKKLTPFSILGLEKFVSNALEIKTSKGIVSIKMSGIIDRIDMVIDHETNSERIRVVDYKTGSKLPSGGFNSVEELFERPSNEKKHADYYIQTMFYSHLIRHDKIINAEDLPVSPALLFIQHPSEDPILTIAKRKINDIINVDKQFMSNIVKIIEEIFDQNTNFEPTLDRKNCTSCPYRELCFS